MSESVWVVVMGQSCEGYEVRGIFSNEQKARKHIWKEVKASKEFFGVEFRDLEVWNDPLTPEDAETMPDTYIRAFRIPVL